MTDPTRFVALLADENGDDFEAEVVLATAFDEAVEVVQGLSAIIAARDDAWAEADAAVKRGDYWKAEHLAGNAEIERLRGLLRQARYVVQYAFDDESANEPHDRDENAMYAGMLRNIDAALAGAPVQPTAALDEGWKRYYELRRQVAEGVYPGMTAIVRAADPTSGGHSADPA